MASGSAPRFFFTMRIIPPSPYVPGRALLCRRFVWKPAPHRPTGPQARPFVGGLVLSGRELPGLFHKMSCFFPLCLPLCPHALRLFRRSKDKDTFPRNLVADSPALLPHEHRVWPDLDNQTAMLDADLGFSTEAGLALSNEGHAAPPCSLGLIVSRIALAVSIFAKNVCQRPRSRADIADSMLFWATRRIFTVGFMFDSLLDFPKGTAGRAVGIPAVRGLP